MNNEKSTNENGAKIRAEYVAIKGDRANAATQFFFALRWNGRRHTAFELLCGGIVGLGAEHFGEQNREFTGRFSKRQAAALLPEFMRLHRLDVPKPIEDASSAALVEIATAKEEAEKREKAIIAEGAKSARAKGAKSWQSRWIRLVEKYASKDEAIKEALEAQRNADAILRRELERRDKALAEAKRKAEEAERRKAARAEKHANGCEAKTIKPAM